MKPSFIGRRRRFLAPPADEVELHRQASAVAADPALDLDAFLAASDIDLATCVLYHVLLRSRHGSFAAAVDRLPAAASPCGAGLKVILVPGLFHREHPEVGADGSLVEGVLRRCGFEVQRVPTDCRNSVSANAALVRAALEGSGRHALWLASLSKGTAEVRHCLQGYAREGLPRSLRGWLNFSGIFSGSVLADARTANRLGRHFLAAVCRVAGVHPGLAGELSRANPLWTADLSHLDGIRIVHVVGFPLRSHVQPMLSHRYAQAAASGPTDGVIRLRDALDYPGQVYPVWGCDHFARSPRISGIVYRLAHLMAATPASGTLPAYPARARTEAA